MRPLREGDGERDDRVPPTPPPSSRVQLEVAILDADYAAGAPAPVSATDERTCHTVLVLAAEADVRGYIRECLRERKDLRVVEAATVTAAVGLAAHCSPKFLVVDEPQSGIIATLSTLPAIVIVDDAPHGVPAPRTEVRLLARPFAAIGLLAEVGRLLS